MGCRESQLQHLELLLPLLLLCPRVCRAVALLCCHSCLWLQLLLLLQGFSSLPKSVIPAVHCPVGDVLSLGSVGFLSPCPRRDPCSPHPNLTHPQCPADPKDSGFLPLEKFRLLKWGDYYSNAFSIIQVIFSYINEIIEIYGSLYWILIAP